MPDATSSTALRQDYTERFGVRSALFVPLAWGGDVRWVTVLIRSREEAFTDDQIELAQLMANVAAAGPRAARGARAPGLRPPRRRRARPRRGGAERLDGPQRPCCERSHARPTSPLEGDMAGFYLGDAVTGGVATAGHNTPEGWTGYHMRPGEGVGGQVLQSGRAAITSAYQTEVELPENPGLQDLRTAVAVPVRWGGEVRGALSIGFGACGGHAAATCARWRRSPTSRRSPAARRTGAAAVSPPARRRSASPRGAGRRPRPRPMPLRCLAASVAGFFFLGPCGLVTIVTEYVSRAVLYRHRKRVTVPSVVDRRLAGGVVALVPGAARPPRGVRPEADGQRGRPGRHGQGDRLALLDRDVRSSGNCTVSPR